MRGYAFNVSYSAQSAYNPTAVDSRGAKLRARCIPPHLSRVCRISPAAERKSGTTPTSTFLAGPSGRGERASQKSLMGLLWLGAERRVGGGWSPVTVVAQNVRSGGAGWIAAPSEDL